MKDKTADNTRGKIKFGIAPKFIIGIVIIVILVTTAAVIIGARNYRNAVTGHYNTVAYQTADAVRKLFTDEELSEYADLAMRYMHGEATDEEVAAVTGSERYRDIKKHAEQLCRSMDANDIYVVVYNVDVLDDYTPEKCDSGEWAPLCYIMDTYYIEEEQYPMGSTSAVDPNYRYSMLDCWNEVRDPVDDVVVTCWHGQYILTATHFTACNGKPTAIVGVEIPMRTLRQDITKYIIRIVSIVAAVSALIVIIGVTIVVRTMIKPIITVAGEAERFGKDNIPGEEVLAKIKTRDEIQLLSEELLSLENNIIRNMGELERVTAERERIGAELEVAAHIQSDMLPKDFPERKDFALYASMTPAKKVGGDFYDFFLIDDDHLALVIGDVSGKGVPAALFMVISKTLLKGHTIPGKTPSQILAEVNNELCADNDSGLFVTIWIGILTLSTGELISANAGHEYPAILRSGGSYELAEAENCPPLAAMEDMEYDDETITLNKGDRLFLYTDGVPEAKNADGARFGTDKMLEMLNRCKNMPPEKLLADVKNEVYGFTGENDLFDDLTMMNLTYNGK